MTDTTSERRSQRRSRRGERTVLALALGAAGALVAAAVLWGDGDVAARASLERLAETVGESLRAEWAALMRPDEPLPSQSEAFVVRGDHAAIARLDARLERLVDGSETAESDSLMPGGRGPFRVPAALARPLEDPAAADGQAGSARFALLFRAATAHELGDGDLARALELCDTALALEGLSRLQRTRVRLRAVQYAAARGDAIRARAEWDALELELERDETLDGLPVVLAAGLAAAPALPDEERAALGDDLAHAWQAGELALPGSAARLERRADGRIAIVLDPLRAALAERVAALGEEARARLADVARADRRAALRAAVGGLPPVPAAGWQLEDTALGLLLVRALAAGDGAEYRFVSAADLAAELERRARSRDLLPADFALLADAGSEAAGEPLALAPGVFEPRLVHADPEGFLRGERRRRLAVRLGFLAAAALCLVAGLSSWRSLARERSLAEAKTRFVANVSHELRTPVASILLLAENLEEGRVSANGAARYPGLIRREAVRLRRLVEDVLDFSRLERGVGARLQREPVDLASWCAELGSELEDWQRARRAPIALAAEGDLPVAEVDGEALRRAVLNLVDNALKHGGDLPVDVRVRAAGGTLRVDVRDRGPGIPAAERERVFEPFLRLEAADGPAGTGLGLAIVREIARAHGGEADVTAPAEGPGALFRLRVPLEVEEDAEMAPPDGGAT